MRVQKATVHMTNGEVASLTLTDMDINDWISDVNMRGVISEEVYIPNNSITYIQFDEPIISKDIEELEVEFEEED